MFKFQFQTNNPFEKRIQECNLISIKYPKRIPIICETHNNNLKLQEFKKYFNLIIKLLGLFDLSKINTFFINYYD